jgi:hypothetical protein
MYEIVHHVPLSYLSHVSMREAQRKSGRSILRRILTAILECRTREGLELRTYACINERLASVLEVTASAENTLLKAQYTKDLVRHMMVTEAAITSDGFLAYPFSWDQEVLSQFDSLVVATAIGSVAATAKLFTTLDTRHWIQYYYLFSSDKIQSICPLAAAASTGKVEVVQYLFAVFEDEYARFAEEYPVYLKLRVFRAIKIAISTKDVDMIQTLGQFIKKAWMVRFRRGDEHQEDSRYCGGLAQRRGNLELLLHLPSRHPNTGRTEEGVKAAIHRPPLRPRMRVWKRRSCPHVALPGTRSLVPQITVHSRVPAA